MVAGAERAICGVLTMMGATAVVLLTAVDDLHLDAWRREDKTTSAALKHKDNVVGHF